MNIIHIHRDHPAYPAPLRKFLAEDAPETVTAIGNPDILRNKTLAVFISIRCPGRIILETYGYVRRLRESSVAVIGGFHSPMEKECLNILLKGKQPVIFCPARGIETMRIRKEFREPIEEGRFLMRGDKML